MLCRVILDTVGKVQIQNPTQKELGTYGCLVVNDFGFDMETSLLLRAGKTVAATELNMGLSFGILFGFAFGWFLVGFWVVFF